jgi:YidC/Oxa1 family membrane protein insertase
MHDAALRIASALLLSGVLVAFSFILYSVLYPRRASAAPATGSPAAASRDYGYLAPVARPLEWTLREVEQRVTHRTGRSSWGWAIVVTTCLAHLLLFPFRVLAARNAKVMRTLQPRLAGIQARYKEKTTDPEYAREVSALYREHNTHPLSGCIPSLGPFVVLGGFYAVLKGVAELHGARWLWIADLARPEQLPVHVLPLLMIATQLLMNKIAPSAPPPGTDPRMNRLMALMPLLMGIFFYNQPSALVLYWLTGSVMTLGQQWWLARRYGTLSPVP